MSRNFILTVWFSLLGLAVVVVQYFGANLAVTAILAGLVAVSAPITNRIEDWYDQRAERQKLIEEYRSSGKRFVERHQELGFGDVNAEDFIAKIRNEGVEPTKTSVFRAGVEFVTNEQPEHRQDILAVLHLCREIEVVEDSIERSRLKAEIDRLTTSFDYVNPDAPTREFLNAFENVQGAIIHGSGDGDDPFSGEVSDEKQVALEFIMEYGTTEELSLLLFNDRKRSRELRQTLGKLIARGRLSTESVSKEAARRIQSDLDEMGSSTKFLLFSQLIHKDDEVEKAIEKFPHFQIGNKYPDSGFPESIKYMRIYVIYPEFDYGSASNFLESEIIPSIPNEYPEDGFIAAMPLELSELQIFPSHTDFESYLDGTYDTLTFLKTGSGQDLSEIISDTVISEVEISELLATLPFNVINPEMEEREKEVIIDNYETLKEEFSVQELFDWSEVDPDRLGESLSELDDEGDEERWKEVAEQIVKKAREYDTATFGVERADVLSK